MRHRTVEGQALGVRRSVVSPRQDEDACAALNAAAIRAATAELHLMCVAAAGRIVRDRRYAELGLDARTADLVERSWNRRDPALLGRLDLSLGIDGVPRLVGYGADVPATLLESVDEAPTLRDQLIARWRELRPRLGTRIYFAHEDGEATLAFLRATAEASGLATTAIELAELRWDRGRRALVDRQDVPVHAVVKAAAWERLLATPLAPALADAQALWLEPAWKLVLANRAFLPILRQLFPDHPNLVVPAREPAGDLIHAWVIGDAPAGIRWPVSAAAP
jgi:glutathionylspermidine synthase